MHILEFIKPNIDKLQKSKKVKTLIKYLNDYKRSYYAFKYSKNNLEMQSKIRTALSNLGELAVQPLLQEFFNEKSEVKNDALEILRSIRSPSVIKPLEEYLYRNLTNNYWPDMDVYSTLSWSGWMPKDVDVEIRYHILISHDLENLSTKYGKLAIKPIIAAIEDADGTISKRFTGLRWRYKGWKGFLCEQLANIRDDSDEVIAVIAKVLCSSQDTEDAIKALVNLNPKKAVPPLVEYLLNSPSHTPISERRLLFKTFQQIGFNLKFDEIYNRLDTMAKPNMYLELPSHQLDAQQVEAGNFGVIQVLGLDNVEHRGRFHELYNLHHDDVIHGEKVCPLCGRLSVVPAEGRKGLQPRLSDEYRDDVLYSLCLFCGNYSSSVVIS